MMQKMLPSDMRIKLTGSRDLLLHFVILVRAPAAYPRDVICLSIEVKIIVKKP